MDENQQHQSIVFFDGPCLFCQKSVQWLAQHERLGRSLYFAPLQGETAERLLSESLRTAPLEGVVFLDEHSQVHKGAAAIRALANMLRMPWSIGARLMTGWAYQFVAARRHSLFRQKEESCLVSPEMRERVLL
jgi:predicted DCC family thiol-disulfide oxidoreductase YuxK